MTKYANSPTTNAKSPAQMAPARRNLLLFAGMAALLIMVGVLQSWNVAFSILNMCLISAIMALGVNIQWGYAGLFNIGVMGFAALGGLAGVVISMPPVDAAWAAGDRAKAQEINDRLMPLHHALFIESNPVPSKYALELLGMIDFDLDYLQSLGFHRFKLLRSRKGGETGH